MKAILFTCIDSFNKEWQYVVVCKSEDIPTVVADNKKYCTEIIEYKTLSVEIVK